MKLVGVSAFIIFLNYKSDNVRLYECALHEKLCRIQITSRYIKRVWQLKMITFSQSYNAEQVIRLTCFVVLPHNMDKPALYVSLSDNGKSRFILGSTMSKNTSHQKKVQIKVVPIEFCTKKSLSAYVYLP